MNSMIHEFDSVPWLLDDPVAAVTVFARAGRPTAVSRTSRSRCSRPPVALVVTVEVSINAQYGYDIHTEVTGTEGTMSLTPPYGVAVRRVRCRRSSR